MTVFKLYIGGPSQSGKTTSAKLVSNNTGFAHVDLDHDPGIIEAKKIPELAERSKSLRARVLDVIRAMDTNSIIEGSQLRPVDMEEIVLVEPNFRCAFCGYPNIDAAKKLEILQSTDFIGADHLSILSDQELVVRINKYIEMSRKFEIECRALQIPFFDYSDMATISQRQRDLSNMFVDRVAQNPYFGPFAPTLPSGIETKI